MLLYPPYGGIKIRNTKIMQKTTKKQVLNRMNYISGHLEGVKKMIENDKYCVDIIHQNKGIISAIKKVNRIVLENHLHTCVKDAVESRSKKEQKIKIQELLDILENSNQ